MSHEIQAPTIDGLATGLVEKLVRAALSAADAGKAVARAWPGVMDWAGSREGELAIVSIGKAAPGMMSAALAKADQDGSISLGPCLAVVPHGTSLGDSPDGRVEWLWGRHPIADEATVRSAERVAAVAASLGERDGLLLLVGGGGSALSTLPNAGVALVDLLGVTEALMNSGARIHELNAVRGCCEQLKSGGLSALAWPAPTRSMLLSDVVGDDPAVIASGLGLVAQADLVGVRKARETLARYGLGGRFRTIDEHLEAAERQTGRPPLDGVRSDPILIASNRIAVDAVCQELVAVGFDVVERRDGACGEASDVARDLVTAGRTHATAPRAVVWGGETTVTIGDENGRGGRNLELALAAATLLKPGEAVISFATDGVDGMSDGAGAVVDGGTVTRLRRDGVKAYQALQEHDSHAALDAAGAIIRTGATGTNVNDVMLYLAF